MDIILLYFYIRLNKVSSNNQELEIFKQMDNQWFPIMYFSILVFFVFLDVPAINY